MYVQWTSCVWLYDYELLLLFGLFEAEAISAPAFLAEPVVVVLRVQKLEYTVISCSPVDSKRIPHYLALVFSQSILSWESLHILILTHAIFSPRPQVPITTNRVNNPCPRLQMVLKQHSSKNGQSWDCSYEYRVN